MTDFKYTIFVGAVMVSSYRDFEEASDDFARRVLNQRAALSNVRLPVFIWNNFDLKTEEKYEPDEESDEDHNLVARLESKFTGRAKSPVIFRPLTPGEAKMIVDALNNEARSLDREANNNVLQVLFDMIDNDHDGTSRDELFRRLKDAAGSPLTRSQSMRNVATFIERNYVVVHCKIMIGEQA